MSKDNSSNLVRSEANNESAVYKMQIHSLEDRLRQLEVELRRTQDDNYRMKSER